MKSEYQEIWYEEKELAPHSNKNKVMVLQETKGVNPKSFIIPEFYIDSENNPTPIETAIIPEPRDIKKQVKIAIQEILEKTPQNYSFHIYVLRRKDNPKAIGLCIHNAPLKKWSFKQFGLPGMQLKEEETFINDEKI